MKFINKRDIGIILGVLAAALIAWGLLSYFKSSDTDLLYAKIYYGNTVIKTVPLDKDQSFSVPEVPQVVFEVKDKAIAFVYSDCPDQVCVHSGWLSKENDFAACMPNMLSVWIEIEE